jgi:AcrR family transcriptional regulator
VVAREQARTVKAKTRFLREFAQSGNVLRSARAAGVGRAVVYEWKEKDEYFLELYEAAHEDAIDRLEEEARRRAVDGWNEPVYQGGEKVGTIRKFSDAMLALLLKGKRPDTFRERHEHTGKDGGPIGVTPVQVSYHEGMKPPEYPKS